jgi:hypothetical protein
MKEIVDIDTEVSRRVQLVGRAVKPEDREKMRKQVIEDYKTNILNSNGLPPEKLALINVLSNQGDYPQGRYPEKNIGASPKF